MLAIPASSCGDRGRYGDIALDPIAVSDLVIDEVEANPALDPSQGVMFGDALLQMNRGIKELRLLIGLETIMAGSP
jgi:hypothetical protein